MYEPTPEPSAGHPTKRLSAASRKTLADVDEGLRVAYDAAVGSGWSSACREPLWLAAIAAVQAYAALAPNEIKGGRYDRLVVDLCAEASPDELVGWSPDTLRAVRLAATRTLRDPSKPGIRPKAQGLLKRLDLFHDPLLMAREKLLLALAHARQAQRQAPRALADRLLAGGNSAALSLLTRLTSRLRRLPIPAVGSSAHGIVLTMLHELQRLVDSGQYLDPGRQAAVFEMIQRIAAPERTDLPLEGALESLEIVRLQANPAVRLGRQALTAMIFDLDLAACEPRALPALSQHLADLCHVARHLGDIPAGSLTPILFRLRQRLADPDHVAAEPLIDQAIALLHRLEEHRQAWIEQESASIGDDRRADLLHARQRVREIETLVDAVHGLNLARITPLQGAGVVRVFQHLDALALDHPFDMATYAATCQHLASQLAHPALSIHPVWQAGSNTVQQLVAQLRRLAETQRGLHFDRHLDRAACAARHDLLEKQITALEQARQVLASLPLDRSAPEDAAVLAAIARVAMAIRLVAAGANPAELRRAIGATVAAVTLNS